MVILLKGDVVNENATYHFKDKVRKYFTKLNEQNAVF